MLKDFVTNFSLTWTTLKTIVFAVFALACFIYKTKSSKVFVGYSLDAAAVQKLQEFADALAVLQRCSQVWMYKVEQNQSQIDWKYNAGDTFKVAKLPLAIFNRTIPNVETNVRVHGITYRTQAIYFLPERVLVIDGDDVQDVPYTELQIRVNYLEYVESEGHIYRDSMVIGQRWRFINRDGSQDRRFKDNIELPVVRCGILEIQVGGSRLDMMMTDPKAPSIVEEKMRGLTGIGVELRSSALPPVAALAPSWLPEVAIMEAIPIQPNVQNVPGRIEKPCPFCGEQILANAKKCKHCMEWLDQA